MSKPIVSLSMRSGTGVKKGELTPQVGGEVQIEFDPATVSVSTDYSSEDRLVIRVNGESKLRYIGLPQVTLSGGAEVAADGWSVTSGAEWEISSAVSAKVDYGYRPGEHSGLATVTIRFE